MSTQSYTTTTTTRPPAGPPPGSATMVTQPDVISEPLSSRKNGDALRPDGPMQGTPTSTHPLKPDAIPAHFAPTAIRLVFTGAGLGALIGAAATIALPYLLAALASLPSSRDAASEAVQAPTPFYLLPQLYMYLFAWASFHLLEFLVTARWNASQLLQDSFLLQNGWNYHAAHIGGIVEFLLEAIFFPGLKRMRWLNYVGLLTVLAGQYVRSTAMIHAASNFSHQVASSKRSDHILVTQGIYAYARHPSYTGFFTWAIGTQVLLGNPVGIAVFALVLWRFFSDRIRSEERYLVHFFGDEYVQYRKRVWSGLVFIP